MSTEKLVVYNTLTRKKENFEPIHAPYVGMYVCGPTVYGEGHLGHARSAITFDIVFRYLQHLKFQVRYVRNITDVGHLEHDADEGEDKIAKKAKLEKLEPMEIVQRYTEYYHDALRKLNVLPPSIEPTASGHIPEQIRMVEEILSSGYGYENEGSVYFDVEKFTNDKNKYGHLSGRILEDLISGTRNLDGQQSKKSSLDFALWKLASPEHIMKWDSPWGKGFPGWHLECSAMSTKYLGETFDIHGGGMDLMFPHHECEIAQSVAANKKEPAKYWLHNNMITINGQKMGKSLGNFITLNELFSGKHDLLEQAYSPMTIRFFVLQAHYRSTLDFSNDALKAAYKAYRKVMNGSKMLNSLEYSNDVAIEKDGSLDSEINKIISDCYKGMADDFNTAIAIASLFNLIKKINVFYLQQKSTAVLSKETFEHMKTSYHTLVHDVLGLVDEVVANPEGLIKGLLDLYKEAKDNKQYDKVDQIRAYFKQQGLAIKDMKHGIDWAYEE
jgi:cysteinyl-tRNA synthetase